ncbi:hypothetical protein L218DRAFT_844028, partial [Marasmius fiardii PR-910]
NALFLKWVKGFHLEQHYKKHRGRPRATGHENAIWSLKHCTTKYEHPAELRQLVGIGPTCVKRLTEKLEKHCERNGIPMPEAPAKRGR